MKRLKFNIDGYNVLMDDPSYMVLQLDIVSTGVNRHGTEFLEEDIIKSIPQLSNKPLNCLIDFGDFEGHADTKQEEERQIAVGTIPESNQATIVEKNGQKFLRVNAIIWKYLFPKAYEILARREEVAISMEITPVVFTKKEDGVVIINEWRYEAVTLLGTYVTPAIPNANAKVVKYSSNDEYFNEVMLNYGLAIDQIMLPNSIVESCKTALLGKMTNPETIAFTNEISKQEVYSYKQLIELKSKFYQLKDGDSINKEAISKWFSMAIKEEGGYTMDKVKEALMAKFSEGLVYVSHNEEKVFCFDYETATYKALNYSSDIIEEEVELKVSEEFSTVIKVKDSDEFVTELLDGQEAEDSAMYSISAYSNMIEKQEQVRVELETLKESYSTLEADKEKINEDLNAKIVDFSAIEVEKKTLEDKILEYANLETELGELRDYKINKEKELKTASVNALYAKYKDFLTDEDTKKLNEKIDEMEFSMFSKEVDSIVMPKVLASLDALKNVDSNNGASRDNLQYSNLPKTKIEDEDEKVQTLLDKLNNI